MAQRISRAKQRIKASGAEFRLPPSGAPSGCRRLHVLYLIFNEGYTASVGRVAASRRADGRGDPPDPPAARAALPDDGEVAGLLALMLLTDARRPARTRADGALVPLAEQDRARWDRRADRGGRRADRARRSPAAPIGPYQLQAAIAARARRGGPLRGHRLAPDPRALRAARAPRARPDGHAQPDRRAGHGRRAAQAWRCSPAATTLAGHYRVDAVRAHLLDLAGDHEAAKMHYRRAAERTLSLPERRYLELKGLAGS